MKFYLDESLSYQIAGIARQLGIDATGSYEQGNNSLSDDDQLAFAADNGYCIVTFDHQDFIQLARRWVNDDRVHHGILLLTPSLPPTARNFTAIAHALKQFSDSHPDGIRHLDWLHGASGS